MAYIGTSNNFAVMGYQSRLKAVFKSAEANGARAATDGKLIGDCPYSESRANTPLRNAWLAGYKSVIK